MFIIADSDIKKKWVIYGVRLNQVDSMYRYIGLTRSGLRDRFRAHLRDSRTRMSPVNRWINKHYEQGLIVEIIDFSADESLAELNELEIFWIANFRNLLGDRVDNGHSLLNIDDGGSTGPNTPDRRRRLSEATTAWFTDDRRIEWSRRSTKQWEDPDLRNSRVGINNPMFGLTGPLSPNYGLVRSEATRKKLSEVQRGVPKPRGKVSCPHCGLLGDISGLKRWHFDNCPTIKPRRLFTCTHCTKTHTGKWYIDKYHNDNCIKLTGQVKLSCPHCNKSGGSSGMKRYHFDNCKTLLSSN